MKYIFVPTVSLTDRERFVPPPFFRRRHRRIQVRILRMGQQKYARPPLHTPLYPLCTRPFRYRLSRDTLVSVRSWGPSRGSSAVARLPDHTVVPGRVPAPDSCSQVARVGPAPARDGAPRWILQTVPSSTRRSHAIDGQSRSSDLVRWLAGIPFPRLTSPTRSPI